MLRLVYVSAPKDRHRTAVGIPVRSAVARTYDVSATFRFKSTGQAHNTHTCHPSRLPRARPAAACFCAPLPPQNAPRKKGAVCYALLNTDLVSYTAMTRVGQMHGEWCVCGPHSSRASYHVVRETLRGCASSFQTDLGRSVDASALTSTASKLEARGSGRWAPPDEARGHACTWPCMPSSQGQDEWI